jgi:predicted NBD/HSP70 family sugar kinase
VGPALVLGRSPSAGTSPGHLLALLRALDGATRADLLRLTGLSRTTLVERLEQLVHAGLVYEAGQRDSTGGRPATVLRFDDRARVLLILDVGQTTGRISVCSLSSRVLAREVFPLDVSSQPEVLVRELLARSQSLLGTLPERHVVGVGLGIPAPVQTGTGTRWPTTTMPHWETYPLSEDFARLWPVPLLVENDARALTLGEYSPDGDSEGSEVVLGIKYASGLGAGVVVDGHALRGSSGAAGDIGHIRVSSSGPRCRCGRRGCLAAHVSGRALLRDLRHTGVRSLDDLVTRLDAGDRAVTPTVRVAARLFGRTLTSTVQFLNPSTVVLGGILGRHPVVAGEITREIQRGPVPRIARHVTVTVGALGEDAATVGLCRLVLSHVYAPEQVDAVLAAA